METLAKLVSTIAVSVGVGGSRPSEDKSATEDAGVDDGRVKIQIQYCDSCGFSERAEKAKAMLYEEFPATVVDIKLVPDKDVTGNFEMTVDGKLVHSKKTRNEGFFHNNARQQVIVIDAINEAFEQRKKEREAALLSRPPPPSSPATTSGPPPAPSSNPP